MKKGSIVSFIIGIIILIIGTAYPYLFGFSFAVEGVSEYYLTRGATHFAFILKLYGVTTAFCGLFSFIFHNLIHNNCSLKSSSIALGISATTSLGIHCIISYLSCYFLTHPEKHPIRHPASIILGLLCLMIFFALFYFYIKHRKENRSIKGIIIDVCFGLIYLFPFYCTYVVADNMIGSIWF